jgi:hypothetical protein
MGCAENQKAKTGTYLHADYPCRRLCIDWGMVVGGAVKINQRPGSRRMRFSG